MASNSVEIIISARDTASAVFRSLGSATKAYSTTLAELNGHARSAASSMLRLGTTLAGGLGFREVVQTGFEFNSMMEDSRLGLASLIASTMEYSNSRGEAIQGEAAWTAAMRDAAAIQERMKVENLTTAATFDELSRALNEGFIPATAAGFNLQQVQDFTIAVVKAATAMRVPLNQLGEEMRSILTGSMESRNTRLMPLMMAAGLTNEKIKELAASGQLYHEVMKAFEGSTKGAQEAADNFTTKLSNLKDAAQQALGTALKGTFDAVKSSMDGISQGLVTIDQEAGSIRVNEGFAAAFLVVDRAIVSVIANIRALSSAISGFAAEHPIITEVAVKMAAIAAAIVAAGAAVRTFGGAVKWAFALASANVAYFTTAAAGIGSAIMAVCAGGGPLAIFAAAVASYVGGIAVTEVGKWIASWEIAGNTIQEHLQRAALYFEQFVIDVRNLSYGDFLDAIKGAWDLAAEYAKSGAQKMWEALKSLVSRAADLASTDVRDLFGGGSPADTSAQEASIKKQLEYLDLVAKLRRGIPALPDAAGEMDYPPQGPAAKAKAGSGAAAETEKEWQKLVVASGSRLDKLKAKLAAVQAQFADKKGTEEYNQVIRDLTDQINQAGGGLKAATQSVSDWNRVWEAGEEIRKSVRTDLEAYQDELQRLQWFHNAGAISLNTYEKAVDAAAEKIGIITDRQREWKNQMTLHQSHLDAFGRQVVDATGAQASMDAGIRTGGGVNAYASQAWQEHQNAVKGTKDQYEDLKRTIEGFGKDSAAAMADFFMGTETSFGDMLRSMTRELLQMTIYEGFMKNVFGWMSRGATQALGAVGGMFGFARGGVANILGQPVPAYASGGVVSRPSLAWIGEGKKREAIVPLPDGRAIPAIITEPKRGGGVWADGRPPILNTSINVTVNTTTGAGGQADPQAAKQTADLVAKAVEAQFDGYLQKQLRPGGLLNQGRRA